MSQKNTKGKWQKIDDDKKKQEMRERYLENEQKRKQLAIDNLKRRKQIEKKRQNEIELKKQQQQQSLKARKQNQDQAYLKYLRRNTIQQGMNLYDRTQAEKKQKKEQVVQVRSTKKWGQQLSNSRQKRDDNILGLDLDVHVTKDMQKIKKFYQQGNQKLKLLQDFQKQWQQSQDLIQSSLLDSLDLDKNSIANSKIISKGVKKQPIFESYQKMKESFLSQSLDQIPQKIQHKQEEKKQTNINQQKQRKKEIKTQKNKFQQQLKQLLGFDSLNESSAIWHIEAFKKKQINTCNNEPLKKQNLIQEPQIKQTLPKRVQLFNWAPEIKEVQQSGVSSNVSKKPKRRQQILQNVNQRIRDEKQLQKQYQVPKIQQRRKSLQQKKQIQRRYSQLSQQRARKLNKSRDKSMQHSRKKSEDKLPPIKPNFKQSRYSNITAPVAKSAMSKDSRITAPIPSCKQSKTVERFKSNVSKNTGRYFDNPQTTFSQDDNLDIQQFIKDDLLDLNEREKDLQKQIKNIHFNNKAKVKQIQDKYKIQTNYKNTKQYLNKEVQNTNSKKIQCFTQDQLQDSLMRLDDLLKKQDRKLNYLSNLPIQQDKKESQDSLRISDSLDSECNSKYQHIKNNNDHPNSELLSDIIKLAARNIGHNDTNIDLNKLRQQLSRQSEQNIIQKSNFKQQQKKPIFIKQQKQQSKKDFNQLSYLQIMKIKNAALTSNTKSKQEKSITKHNDSSENMNVNPIVQSQKQIIIKQTKDEKISVNERLRRLLLQ